MKILRSAGICSVPMALLIFICVCTSGINGEEDSSEERLKKSLQQIGRQLMLQQLYIEERTRSEGDSGLKIVRLNEVGPRPYYSATHSSIKKVAAIHNHDNNIRTVGLGEFVAVLNGVEFRTRHNDFPLYMPSTNSTKYHQTEPIPFPQVPPEVLQHTKVADQVTEMREWFKAFKNQNTTHRDYRPYFKPVLCYLEGAWTRSTDKLEESFKSDRHSIDAETWYELQEKIRYTAYTGRKSALENYAYLPTTIMEFINGTIPYVAQWNYRVLCHPLENDLPLNRMRPVDDLASRMRDHMDFYEYEKSRSARFQLNPVDSDEWTTETPEHQFLDSLMGEIPGKDNYLADIVDNVTGESAFAVNGDKDQPLNVGYYHRVFRVDSKDAMGLDKRRRGFNDQNVFMAATRNSQVAPLSVTYCNKRKGKRAKCDTYTESWSYAIPLEVIYLTPLPSWNPYNLQYKGEKGEDLADEVTANGRNGGDSDAKAYDGIRSNIFYMTPAEFFSGMEENDPADTSTGAVWVLDPSRTRRKVSTSGVRINMQTIAGVGVIRQRYPITPIHGEGNTIYKELEALKDIVLNPKKYAYMIGDSDVDAFDKGLTLRMGASSAKSGSHEHYIYLTGQDVQLLYEGTSVNTTSSYESSHSHNLLIKRISKQGTEPFYRIDNCDKPQKKKCSDGHPRELIIE